MFLVSGLVMCSLFLLSLIVPFFFGWMLPYYKIKKVNVMPFKERVFANIVAILLIALIDKYLLVAYIGIYMTIELLYYLLEKQKFLLGMIDKIMIINIIITSILCVYIVLNKESVNSLIEILKKVYVENNLFSEYETEILINNFRNNFIYLIFIGINILNFMLYFVLNRENYFNWEISYKWLIPYVILFFIYKISNSTNMNIINNFLESLKIGYIIYFSKNLSNILNTKISNKSICIILGLIMAFIMPEFAFIIGGLSTGIKFKILRQKN